MATEMATSNDISTEAAENKIEVSAPKMAWGKIEAPVVTASLSDVMSEQLASEMYQKEVSEKKKKERIDENLAKALQDEESFINESHEGTSGTMNNIDIPNEIASNDISKAEKVNNVDDEMPDTNDDFLIAQMLQNQFDNEYDTVISNEENAYNRNSKIKVSYEKYKVMQSNHPIWDDSDDEDPELLAYLDMDDRKRNWDYFEAADKETMPMPRCGYQKIGGKVITKHDKEINQRTNGKRVMAMAPGIQTGDGGAFDMQLSNSVYNELKKFSIKDGRRRAGRIKDKIEKSTAEQAVDPQTKLILFKFINNGILENVNGVISTGKEAVILHAEGGPGPEPEQAVNSKGGHLEQEVEPMNVPKECVVKVFKTTLNEFKNREIYIKDDYRFRDRFSKQNPRKVIHMWAEKELHNLVKMSRHGLRVPDAVLLKKHVLLMSFIGHDGTPAPKLKDAVLSYSDLEIAYNETIEMMKKLYNSCHLVHADLSEYNILWHDNQCWFIDVSQSVEPNHPHGLEFLYRDCVNVTNFFNKKGIIDCLTAQKLFTQITGLALTDDENDNPQNEAEILARVRDYERSQEVLSLSSAALDDDFEVNLDLLKDYEDEKNLETFKNLRIKNNESGKPYPFEYCWEESQRKKSCTSDKEKSDSVAVPLPVIPGHSKHRGGKSPKSPKSGASIIVTKSPNVSSSKSPKSGVSLASMTSEELKALKDAMIVEDEANHVKLSDRTKKTSQVNFKLDDE